MRKFITKFNKIFEKQKKIKLAEEKDKRKSLKKNPYSRVQK